MFCSDLQSTVLYADYFLGICQPQENLFNQEESYDGPENAQQVDQRCRIQVNFDNYLFPRVDKYTHPPPPPGQNQDPPLKKTYLRTLVGLTAFIQQLIVLEMKLCFHTKKSYQVC